MNWDVIEGKWKQVKGEVKSKWGKLTDDDLDVIAGNKDKFLGKLQERYGMSKDQAERDLDTWRSSLDKSTETPKVRTGGQH
jgi:uncharacterized protein YjbJ (UPF0337 family)